MLKTVTHEETGRVYRMGRRRPATRVYGLRLGLFVEPSRIHLPDRTDYARLAAPCLGQMMLNDELSCCTAAAAFHIEGVLQANAGRPQQKFSNEQIERFYAATTGYRPGKAETDLGGDESVVLNYWRDHGLYKNGHRCAGHATVDASDWDLVRTAIYLFENVYFGMSMPDAWISPPPERSGWIWDVAGAPNDANGHAVAGVDYELGAVRVSSWGMLGSVTRRAVAEYAVYARGGELHTVLSYDAIDRASKKAPNGFQADELYAEFRRQFPEG